MIENDLMEKYLFIQSKDTGSIKPIGTIKPKATARITRDNAVIAFQNQELQ